MFRSKNFLSCQKALYWRYGHWSTDCRLAYLIRSGLFRKSTINKITKTSKNYLNSKWFHIINNANRRHKVLWAYKPNILVISSKRKLRLFNNCIVLTIMEKQTLQHASVGRVDQVSGDVTVVTWAKLNIKTKLSWFFMFKVVSLSHSIFVLPCRRSKYTTDCCKEC